MAQIQVGTPPAATTRPAAGTQAALAAWVGLSALVAVFLIGVIAFLSRDGWLDGAISSSAYLPEAAIQATAMEPAAVVLPALPIVSAAEPVPATAVLSVSVEAPVAAEPAPEPQVEAQVEAQPEAVPSVAPPVAPPGSQPPARPAPTTVVPLRQVTSSAPPKPTQPAAEPVAVPAPAKPGTQPVVVPELKPKTEFTPPTPKPVQPTKAAFVPPSS